MSHDQDEYLKGIMDGAENHNLNDICQFVVGTKGQDPRVDDPDWLPPEAEIGRVMFWNILVLPRMAKLETESGIDLSAAAELENFSCYLGRVVSVGKTIQEKDGMREDDRVKRGDWVIYAKLSGTKTTWRGVELVLIHDDHVKMVVTDPSDWKFYL